MNITSLSVSGPAEQPNLLKTIKTVLSHMEPHHRSLSGSLLQVKATLILDVVQLAETIEQFYGEYLLPAQAGYYLPTSLTPVLKPGLYYYQRKTVAGSRLAEHVPVTNMNQLLAADILDSQAQLVVPKEMIKLLQLQPYLPARGLELIYSAVDHVLRQHSAWAKKSVGRLGAFISEHLCEEFGPCLPESEADLELLKRKGYPLEAMTRNSELREKLVQLLEPMRDQVRQFIGDDKWVMHFHYARGQDIVVEKTVDFRIFDWERRMASGEWK